MDRIGVSVLLYKVQEALAVVGKRRKAGQSGGRAGRANPDEPPAAPRLAELHSWSYALATAAARARLAGCLILMA